ncbi:MFS transporter [Pollutibacter soli]|uniref:MFS transporter n=1 Tax=Pollutibacter soli TaxID=3034157 RepID=UPI0030141CAD
MDQSNRITNYHWVLFAVCFMGTVFAGTISTLMSVYLPVAVRDLMGEQTEDRLNTISAYINSVFIIGGAIGGFVCGMISDRWGRKAGLLFSIAVYGISAAFTGLMPAWWGVVICRLISGFGLGGVLVTTVTILMEEWPEKSRAIYIGILSISIPIGIFSAGLIDYFVSSWRQAFAVGLLPIIIALIGAKVIRESDQWKSRRKLTIAGEESNNEIFAGPNRNRLVLGSVVFGTMLIGLWAIFSWLPTWIQTLVITGDAQKERGISMMMLGMGGLIGGFISGWLMNAMGTRKAMLLCFAVCSVLSFILFKTNHLFSNLIYIEIFVLSLFFGISQGVLSVYIPALFPVPVRGTATGFCFNAGRILTALAVLFVGVLVTTMGGYGHALFIFSAVFWIGFLVMALNRETKPSLNKEAAIK